MNNKMKQNRQDEMFGHVENFRQSNLTQKEYCLRHGLTKDEIYYWLKKYDQLQNPISNQFIPVEICKPTIVSQNKFTIHYPNGVELSIPSPAEVSLIKALIQIC